MSLRKHCVALAIWNEVKSSNRQGCDCFPSLTMTVNIFVQLLKVKTELQVDVKDIDHLWIIAGIIDEIGIVKIIDQEIGTHAQEKVSAGLVVKAMIINCMGFITAPFMDCT
ncbi:DUF4277 domain-containing protein [Dolichospermum sp. LEGE 00246]|nr:DUF4277 domain-containing protein [Aphanizomenon flos-aquae]MBE9260659.1 DUF4277 domain-containing protein [Dolichospermum sp. LEGE 00246]